MASHPTRRFRSIARRGATLVEMAFVLPVFIIFMLGLIEVILDYAHDKAWRTGLLIGSQMFCGFFGLAGIFAVLKIALAG